MKRSVAFSLGLGVLWVLFLGLEVEMGYAYPLIMPLKGSWFPVGRFPFARKPSERIGQVGDALENRGGGLLGPSRALHQFGFPSSFGGDNRQLLGGTSIGAIPPGPYEFYGQEGGGHNFPDKVAFETFFKNPEVKKGVFVEIGAQDGIRRSNTLFFEKFLDWSGLLIEGSPVNFQKLEKNIKTTRFNSKPIHSAFCAQQGMTPFLGDGGTGVATAHMPDGWIEKWSKFWVSPNAYSVPCDRMDKIILNAGLQKIDMMSIDISGAEAAALETMNFKIVPVRVVVAECGGGAVKDIDCRRILESNGFCMANQVGSNVYYTSDPAHISLCMNHHTQAAMNEQQQKFARQTAKLSGGPGASPMGPPSFSGGSGMVPTTYVSQSGFQGIPQSPGVVSTSQIAPAGPPAFHGATGAPSYPLPPLPRAAPAPFSSGGYRPAF